MIELPIWSTTHSGQCQLYMVVHDRHVYTFRFCPTPTMNSVSMKVVFNEINTCVQKNSLPCQQLSPYPKPFSSNRIHLFSFGLPCQHSAPSAHCTPPCRFFSFCAIQPSPSNSPSPVTALEGCICQSCFRIVCSMRAWDSSATSIASFRSCLLASTSTGTSDMSLFPKSVKSSACGTPQQSKLVRTKARQQVSSTELIKYRGGWTQLMAHQPLQTHPNTTTTTAQPHCVVDSWLGFIEVYSGSDFGPAFQPHRTIPVQKWAPETMELHPSQPSDESRLTKTSCALTSSAPFLHTYKLQEPEFSMSWWTS